jgi:predicted HicB family RNase H-like nuclease
VAFFTALISRKGNQTFQGTTVSEIQQALIDSVEGYLEFCAELGEEPEQPYSGHLAVELPKDLHRDIVWAATLDKKNLNGWISEQLAKAANSVLSGHAGITPLRGVLSL